MEVSKTTGMPLGEGLEYATDLPHTITFAVTYRTKLNSFYDLPKDKQPPRNLWDKPYQLEEFLEDMFNSSRSGSGDGVKTKVAPYIEFNAEDVE